MLIIQHAIAWVTYVCVWFGSMDWCTVSMQEYQGTTMVATGPCGSCPCLGAQMQPRCWRSLMSWSNITQMAMLGSLASTMFAKCSASVSLPTSLLALKLFSPNFNLLTLSFLGFVQLGSMFLKCSLFAFTFFPFLSEFLRLNGCKMRGWIHKTVEHLLLSNIKLVCLVHLFMYNF